MEAKNLKGEGAESILEPMSSCSIKDNFGTMNIEQKEQLNVKTFENDVSSEFFRLDSSTHMYLMDCTPTSSAAMMENVIQSSEEGEDQGYLASDEESDDPRLDAKVKLERIHNFLKMAKLANHHKRVSSKSIMRNDLQSLQGRQTSLKCLRSHISKTYNMTGKILKRRMTHTGQYVRGSLNAKDLSVVVSSFK
uniref:Uncharacterized protein n=1 Tax=Glossina pallidipes TaxID=7398 RepID=A0A1A9Z859_GLOPL